MPELMVEAAEITSGRKVANKHDLYRDVMEAEHSPVRLLLYWVVGHDVPERATTHLVRHAIGNVFFVSTARPDRGGGDGKFRTIGFLTNHQALVNMARKRLCSTAWHETRDFVLMLRGILPEETARYMVPECEYRGGVCHEPKRAWTKCQRSPHYTEL